MKYFVFREKGQKCPLCKEDSYKIIYYGLPVRLCKNEQCNCMFGFWCIVMDFFPFNGVLFKYKESYIIALYRWLKG